MFCNHIYQERREQTKDSRKRRRRQHITLPHARLYYQTHSDRVLYLSPTILSLQFVSLQQRQRQQEKAWLLQSARRQEEGRLPQTLTRDFTFLQPAAHLAQTLPRAVRYFPMNYKSEPEMKALSGSQEQQESRSVRLFVLWSLWGEKNTYCKTPINQN